MFVRIIGNDESFETMEGDCDNACDIIDEKLRKVKTQRGKVGKRRQRQQQGSAAEATLMNFTFGQRRRCDHGGKLPRTGVDHYEADCGFGCSPFGFQRG